MNLVTEFKEYLEKEKNAINNLNFDEINDSVNEIIKTRDNGGTIYIFGNGGSAATASHMCNDFNKGISEKLDKKFNFICLNDNVSTLTAIANDISYEEIFVFQLKNKLKENDLVIGISGSGNSKNIVKALEYAKKQGIKTIGITGYDGGVVDTVVDYHMHAPVDDMQISEDIHMIFDHMIMSVLYKKLN